MSILWNALHVDAAAEAGLDHSAGYTSDILSDAIVFCEHAGKAHAAGGPDVEDVRLAVQAKTEHSMAGPLTKDVRQVFAALDLGADVPLVASFCLPSRIPSTATPCPPYPNATASVCLPKKIVSPPPTSTSSRCLRRQPRKKPPERTEKTQRVKTMNTRKEMGAEKRTAMSGWRKSTGRVNRSSMALRRTSGRWRRTMTMIDHALHCMLMELRQARTSSQRTWRKREPGDCDLDQPAFISVRYRSVSLPSHLCAPESSASRHASVGRMSASSGGSASSEDAGRHGECP